MILKLSRDFSPTPGPRYPSEGKHSGEEFRQKILVPMLRQAQKANVELLVDLDGPAGYGTSFLEESFGGLIREDKFPLSALKAVLRFKSDEEPVLIDEINEYMNDADKELH